MVAQLQQEYEAHRDPQRGLWSAVNMIVRGAVEGTCPEFEACWRASGITAGNRQAGMTNLEEAFNGFALAQAQFDRLPWLVKRVYHHDRGKSDAELRALAATGGYIGVYAVPFFLSGEPEPTIEAMLDHIDYIARLVGPQHVGIGTDWPMQAPE